MNPTLTRRHQRLHELILLSWLFSFSLGWLLAVPLPAWLLWDLDGLLNPNPGQQAALLCATLAYGLAQRTLFVQLRYPGAGSSVYIVPYVIVTFGMITLIALLLRLDLSRLMMVLSGGLTVFWCYVDFVLRQRFQQPKLAVVPFGMARELLTITRLDTRSLQQPALDQRRYDGVVADFSALPCTEWERFLSDCALSRIPVYHAKYILESVTGRVHIDHISENMMGSLLPSPTYERVKYLMDVGLILLSAPITLPLVLITALCIRLDSPGPAIFTQERVGRGNRPFRIYKFRSMVLSSECDGARFADENDARVTRVGQLIRKLRIDEIPQFINVIRGEMSLIGPRPEQQAFVEQFNQIIPFYSYRHVVKPGITGWAQVMQGYAAGEEGTRIKMEHDFYYIKHCSFGLDLLIVLRTIRTILSGFGAR